MQEYHKIWLEKHPERTEEWLKERLKEGFDIHHADGNRNNNDPANLTLIDHVDHMGLHGIPLNRMVKYHKEEKRAERERKAKERFELGKKFYEDRSKPMSWPQIYEKYYGKITTSRRVGLNVAAIAKNYAKIQGLPWPVDVGDFKPEKIYWRGTSSRCGKHHQRNEATRL